MEMSSSRIAPQPPARFRLFFFLGTLLLLGTVVKGVGGYLDHHEYIEMSQNLWLKGDLAADLPVMGGGRYHRYPTGLAFISWPFVYLGQLAESLTGAPVGATITVAMIPVLAALAALVLVDIAILLGFSLPIAFWSGVLFIFSTPLLTYTRIYYCEVAVVFFMMLGFFFWLRLQQTADNRARCRGLLLTGVSFAAAIACHHVNLPLITFIGLAMIVATVRAGNLSSGQRATQLVLLVLPPLLAIGSILLQNTLFFGGPFKSGYDQFDRVVAPDTYSENLLAMGFQFVRVPWLLLIALVWRRLREESPVLFYGILAGGLVQHAFFLNYTGFFWFHTRYEQGTYTALALALPFILAELRRRWPARVFEWTVFLLLLSSSLWFLACDDRSPPFQILGSGDVHAFVWYQRGYYLRPLEYAVGLVLLVAGILLLWRSWRLAGSPDASSAPVPSPV
jgi:hypothetical protein